MSLYVDRRGRQISLLVWARLFEDFNYQSVAKTRSGDAYLSTVWMGTAINENLFETSLFRGGSWEEQARYQTEQEALEGHFAALRAHQDLFGPDPETTIYPCLRHPVFRRTRRKQVRERKLLNKARRHFRLWRDGGNLCRSFNELALQMAFGPAYRKGVLDTARAWARWTWPSAWRWEDPSRYVRVIHGKWSTVLR